MKHKYTIALFLAIVFCHSLGYADSNTDKLPVTSSWVGEDISGAGDNYFLYNCTDNASITGYLGTQTINGVLRPVVYYDYNDAELFYVERGSSYYTIQRTKDRSYLYSDYSKSTYGEFNSSTARRFEVDVNSNSSSQTYALAIGKIYSFKYRNNFLNSYRYLCSEGNQPTQVKFETSGEHKWVCISEKQFEFRPKLDAACAMVEQAYPNKENMPEDLRAAYNTALVIRQETAPQDASNSLADEMMYACNLVVTTYYKENATALTLWNLIKETADLASDLKTMLGEAPSDIKEAVEKAFIVLVEGVNSKMQQQVTKGSDGNKTLHDVYYSYVAGSLNIYQDLLSEAQALGYTVSDSLMTQISQATSREDYEKVAVSIRKEFKDWLNGRITKGQGFPKNTDLSMLLVNNSFELGSLDGWTVASNGYWIMHGNDDVTSQETTSWSRHYTHVLKSDTVGTARKVEGAHGSFYFQSYDIHEYADGNKKKNIYHGYNIGQDISGLPAGIYELSALVSLVKGVSYGSKDYEKSIYLTVWTNSNTAEGVGRVCNTESFKTVSQQVSVSGPTDVVHVNICGSTVEGSYRETLKTYKLSRIIPFLVDNVQLKLVDANVTSGGENPDSGSGTTEGETAETPNQGTAFTFNEGDATCPIYVAGEEYSDVVVNRTIKNNGYWNTLCLPFALNETQTASYFEDVYTLSGLTTTAENDNVKATLSFTKVSAIKAGKPYLVKANNTNYPNGLTQMSAKNVTMVKSPEPVSFKSQDGSLMVTFEGVFCTIYGDYIPYAGMILQDNAFYLISEMTAEQRTRTRMKGFRCFFTFDNMVEMSAPTFNLMMEDETSGLEQLPEPLTEDDCIYDLQGRKMQQAARGGLYIVNGKKYIIR